MCHLTGKLMFHQKGCPLDSLWMKSSIYCRWFFQLPWLWQYPAQDYSNYARSLFQRLQVTHYKACCSFESAGFLKGWKRLDSSRQLKLFFIHDFWNCIIIVIICDAMWCYVMICDAMWWYVMICVDDSDAVAAAGDDEDGDGDGDDDDFLCLFSDIFRLRGSSFGRMSHDLSVDTSLGWSDLNPNRCHAYNCRCFSHYQ